MEKLYNFDQLKDIAAGNEEFLVSLVVIFLKTIPDYSKELVAATETKEWKKVSTLAHKMKSTIDSLEIISIQKDIRIVEIDAKNKVNTAELMSIVLRIDKIINQVANQLREEFSL